ncbi:MAG TPA: hypothetical protein PK537_00190 [Candidatus Limiplasma sp.]|nr:hypothetical protein [Candidatus Limiplasma sp.]
MSKRIFPKVWAAFLIYLATLPLFLLPAAALIPGHIWIAGLLPVPALLLTAWAGRRTAAKRVPTLLFSILLMAAGCTALFIGIHPLAILLFLPCLFLMLIFMPAMARPAHQEWPASYLGFGIVVHIIAQFVKNMDVFAGAASIVTWAFAVYLIACLFAFNRSVLMDNSPSTSKPLLSFNRGLLVGFSLLAVLLANIKAVGTAIRSAVLWIVQAIIRFILWFSALFGGGEEVMQSGETESQSMELLGETSEPSLFARIMEVVLAVIAVAAVALLLYFVGKHLYKLLKKLYHIILNQLQAYRQKISADYSDQSESLLDWSEMRKTARERIDRFRRRYLPTAWEKLTPAQRVRRVYAILLRKPEAPDPALTAQEMLKSGALKLSADDAAALAALYDQARYSDHPITDRQASEARKRTGV